MPETLLPGGTKKAGPISRFNNVLQVMSRWLIDAA